MPTALYYFSGTGNSLSVARTICNQIEGCELYSIVGTLKQKPVRVQAERVGLIFPMHFMGVPRIVQAFLSEIIFENPKYVFVVMTGANPKLGNAFSQVKKQLNGVILNAAFFVPMVAAHFPPINLLRGKAPEELYQQAEEKALCISDSIIRLEPKFDKELAILGHLKHVVSKGGQGKEKHFYVGEGCICCGYCMQVCPVQNIRMNGCKIEWLDNCQNCFACLHFCSQSVIQYKKASVGKPRYHHPSVSLTDIASQRGE